MKKLSRDFKRMLSALAYQDAGEFLSGSEKLNVLNAQAAHVQKNKKQELEKLQQLELSQQRV